MSSTSGPYFWVFFFASLLSILLGRYGRVELWRALRFFRRQKHTQEPGVTSEEYSTLFVQLKPGDSQISNQSGKVPPGMFFFLSFFFHTVAMPQRQPQNASFNSKA